MLGHPLPGYVDDAHGIVNMLPLRLRGSRETRALGYIYMTAGGRAYFIATVRSYAKHFTRTSGNEAIDVGTNTSALRLSPSTRNRIQADLYGGTVEFEFVVDSAAYGPACFAHDWDGRSPWHHRLAR